MKYINEIQIKTVQAINFIMKFPKRQFHFGQQLASNYYNKPLDYEAGLAYGFYKYYEITRIVQGQDLANTDILQVIKIYDQLLKNSEDDWFVHILKLLLYDRLPIAMIDEVDLLRTLYRLFTLQENAANKQPYFILPFVIHSEYYIRRNRYEEACRCLLEGLKKAPHTEIPYPDLIPHFFSPVKELYYTICQSSHKKLYPMIEQILLIYFPKEADRILAIRENTNANIV